MIPERLEGKPRAIARARRFVIANPFQTRRRHNNAARLTATTTDEHRSKKPAIAAAHFFDMDYRRSSRSTSSSSAIESWLESLDDAVNVVPTDPAANPDRPTRQPFGPSSRKRRRSDMPSPSGSGGPGRDQGRASSPSKRPRLDSAADSDIAETSSCLSLRTATSTSSRRLSAAPSLPASSAPASSATRRSASPTKKVSDLTFFRKPVHYVHLSDKPLQQLPDDVRDLYRTISNIQYLESFIPDEVRHDLACIIGPDSLRDGWFQAPAAELTPEQEVLAAEARALRRRTCRPTTRQEFTVSELDTLCIIEADAKDCLFSSEAAWNTFVHYPLLKHALAGFRYLRVEMATTAQIAKAAMPQTNKTAARDLVSQGKMIDMAITLRLPDRPSDTTPPADTRLVRAIRSAVNGPADGLESVNQTMYEPVRFAPIAVSIETKTSAGDDEAAKVQLGVWVAAWHHRLEAFRRYEGTRIVTLPLLLVTGHHWKLLRVTGVGVSKLCTRWRLGIHRRCWPCIGL